jgi:hypothetical protein|tara:strand:- start:4096 stop:4506 length:411 start_codon:yes stop_codon:yes gene_type:complete
MYKIDEVFNQAMEDFRSIKPTDFSAINNGVKIQKFPSKTEILNCGRSGDYFQECNKEEYKLFFKYGWREGGVRLSMVNCKRKLGMIEEKIRAEVNTRKNDKHIQKLKVSREKLLLKYSNRMQQLNKITNGKKEKHL